MNPLDFLAAVLPPSEYGVYCAAGYTKQRKTHVFVRSFEALIEQAQAWAEAKRDVYFGLSAFDERVLESDKNKDRRTADNARAIKSLFIDMDGYESEQAALDALNAFLEKTELQALGRPWRVWSGGGLHVYWPFVEACPIIDWKSLAENFKRLCKQEGMRIDMTVTADAARVLRVPGTFNFKPKYESPRPVELLEVGGVFAREELAALVRDKLTAPPYENPHKNVIDLPGARPTAPTATVVKMFENTSTRFKNILKATAEGRGCGQLEYYIEHAEEDGMEPLWRGLLSIAQKCDDGNKAAEWLSARHPYPPERMHQKLREIKGPYPCMKFDSENPGICTGCRHWGKITNPLALGREILTTTAAAQVEAPVDDAATSDVAPANATLLRPEAPRGYSYGERGGIYAEREEEGEGGETLIKKTMVLPYDLFVVDMLDSHGTHTVHMAAVRPHGTIDVTFPAEAVASKDTTLKALASQNIIATSIGSSKLLYEYVWACVTQASMQRRALMIPDHYGWQKNGEFVYAARVFKKGSLPTKVPMPGLENIVSFTQPSGTLDNWRAFINLLVRRRLYKHLAVFLSGCAAPLMKYTGLFGITLHCCSTDSGTGKSLALEAAASVWGHPALYRTGKSTSPVAMQQRLGLLHSLPLITDELTNVNRKDFEWFPSFLLDMTEGKGKERMEAGANKERLNLSTWRTVALLSSNTHGVDWLTGVRKHSSEGELRRLLEFVMDEQLTWEPHEIETIKSLHENFGIAGYKLVEYMVANEEILGPLVRDMTTRMYRTLEATNDERFWVAHIGCAAATGILMSNRHAGIIDLPLKEIIDAYKECVKFMRNAMAANVRTAETVLSSYIGENYGKLIIVRRSEGGVLAELGAGKEIDQSLTRTSIAGRVEHDIDPGYTDFYIEEQLMKAYCSVMSFGYKAFCDKLAKTPNVVVTFVKKDMTAKTKGPPMRVNAIKVRRRNEDVDGMVSTADALAAA